MSNPQNPGYVLIVDDQPNNLRLLSTTLTEAGYRVRNAISAKMALMGIEKALPQLILLDIMMPQMDGYELCQHLKSNERTQHIPVIFLSALDNEWDKVKAFDVGGTDYITKPFHVKEVLSRVNNQLTIVRQQQHIVEQNQQLQYQNQQLQQLNAELIRSNQDLEEFARIASHDLRSPLQTMKAFGQLFCQKYQSLLDDKAAHYMNRILEAGDRMEQLIQDLLNYSRVETQGEEFEPTDCNQVVESVLANLDSVIQQQDAVITCEHLPIVMADGIQLVQLFQNLISNALKFCSPEVAPEIKIAAELRQKTSSLSDESAMVLPSTPEPTQVNEWVFRIEDNGIGMEAAYFERIFKVFQRLHTNEEYPGTGIGLSICQKIVEHHGGQIWVESSPGVGTTFYFTIPALLTPEAGKQGE
ncbi:sensor histidine kinase [Coleofasciculus sp.]|uniref:sensor histidine kinase n=1 Tax=Coleofasciculus sp. TaxID=3100458 RepID=UPI003A49407A